MAKDIFKHFPDVIHWIKPTLEGLSKVGAFLVESDHYEYGMTRCEGQSPDMPLGADWSRPYWHHSPYDGKAFLFQLNLETIPAEIRKPDWPVKGMVWVFIDLSNDWDIEVIFDERSAKEIQWQFHKELYQATAYQIEMTVPDDDHPELKTIAHNDHWSDAYYDWKSQFANHEQVSLFQVGGWITLIQGATEARQQACVCEMRCPFIGDAGSVYLFYTPEKGFCATIETH